MQPHKYKEKKETDLGACGCMNHATALLKTLCNRIFHVFNRLTKFQKKERL